MTSFVNNNVIMKFSRCTISFSASMIVFLYQTFKPALTVVASTFNKLKNIALSLLSPDMLTASKMDSAFINVWN